jgi:hypothetical protein
MKLIAAFAAGATLTALAMTQLTPEPDIQVITNTEIVERTIIEQVMTTLDIEHVREQAAQLEQLLHAECILAIHWRTGDPIAGIEHLVTRHYAGDACKAAEEALNDRW